MIFVYTLHPLAHFIVIGSRELLALRISRAVQFEISNRSGRGAYLAVFPRLHESGLRLPKQKRMRFARASSRPPRAFCYLFAEFKAPCQRVLRLMPELWLPESVCSGK
jgi:hypothetical protein